MSDYKISVIVPVYNKESYLSRCVDSLLGQTYENLEILLVDDGSTDESGKLCDRYAAANNKIKVIHKENGGLISAWKRGAAESSGEYLCFVDSDDWVDGAMLGEMSGYLTGSPYEMVASDYLIEKDDGSSRAVYQELPPGIYEGKSLEEQVYPRLLGQEHRMVNFSRCMKLISRKLILENQKYSNEKVRMGEDVTVILPALLSCKRLAVMDHKTYYHYFYETASMVHRYDKGMYDNLLLLWQIMKQVIMEKVPGDKRSDMQKKADQEFIFLLLLALKNEARGNPKGYYSAIKRICREEAVQTVVAATQVEVKDQANKLLYLVLRHPGALTIRLLRLAMIIYYKG